MNKPETIDTRAATAHPLTPLDAGEIAAAVGIVRAALPVEGLRVEIVELHEPGKAAVRAATAGGLRCPREAMVSAYRADRIGVRRFVVSLDEGRIVAETDHPDACPMIQLEEFLEIENMVKADPRFVAALAKRGIEDMTHVTVDPWSAGNFGVDGEEGRHLSHTFAWVRARENDNQYAHPIEGVCAVVDIKAREVLRVDDHRPDPVAVPWGEVNFDRDFQTETRRDLRPIDVVQPEGVSFRMEGRTIRWHDWSMVIGFNAREGLTLHDIRIKDRPVLYRASIAEMVVPYGSPKPHHARKNVFDIGEYGIGKLANSLALGCDCLGAIHYLDGVIADIEGVPMTIDNAICIHEEDAGLLWKHYDFRTERTETRRGRRLVISSISTVGNYEYASYWYFYLDGTIGFEMKATGVINTAACRPGEGDPHGIEVAPGVVGQIHQHVFCARLDLAVDGDRNGVVECDTVAEAPGPENPYANAFRLRETVLEREGGRLRAPEHERYWAFVSRERKNAVGRPTAYRLEPLRSVTPFVHPDGPSGRRMPFVYRDLWLTRHAPDRRFPAGEFMNHSDGSDGVAAWTADPAPIDGEDIVAWHVFGLHHMPRPEDFPVQPVVSTGFTLMPSGFFDRNPALDLAPERNGASCRALAAE